MSYPAHPGMHHMPPTSAYGASAAQFLPPSTPGQRGDPGQSQYYSHARGEQFSYAQPRPPPSQYYQPPPPQQQQQQQQQQQPPPPPPLPQPAQEGPMGHTFKELTVPFVITGTSSACDSSHEVNMPPEFIPAVAPHHAHVAYARVDVGYNSFDYALSLSFTGVSTTCARIGTDTFPANRKNVGHSITLAPREKPEGRMVMDRRAAFSDPGFERYADVTEASVRDEMVIFDRDSAHVKWGKSIHYLVERNMHEYFRMLGSNGPPGLIVNYVRNSAGMEIEDTITMKLSIAQFFADTLIARVRSYQTVDLTQFRTTVEVTGSGTADPRNGICVPQDGPSASEEERKFLMMGQVTLGIYCLGSL